MKEHKFPNGIVIEYYDALDELPIVRHHKFNEYLALDSGIGSTVEDVDKGFIELQQMIIRGDRDIALQKIQNIRQAMQFAIENVSPKSMAFGVLVHKVNGVHFDDTTDLGIKKLLMKLSSFGLTWGMVKLFVEEVKKKLMRKSKSTFLIS